MQAHSMWIVVVIPRRKCFLSRSRVRASWIYVHNYPTRCKYTQFTDINKLYILASFWTIIDRNVFCHAADCLFPFRATMMNCHGFTSFCFICHQGTLFCTGMNSGLFFPCFANLAE
jgi:hypothetical protein